MRFRLQIECLLESLISHQDIGSSFREVQVPVFQATQLIGNCQRAIPRAADKERPWDDQARKANAKSDQNEAPSLGFLRIGHFFKANVYALVDQPGSAKQADGCQ
jgi:hypothetical protein